MSSNSPCAPTADIPTPYAPTAETPKPYPPKPYAPKPYAPKPYAPTADTLLVGTRIVPPFVILEDDGTNSGLMVHLWDHIARELDIPYRFRELDTPGMLAGVEDGSLFASAAALTMTTVGYGDKAPRTLGGRAVGFVWMFTAIIVISFFTATIASNLTLTRLDSRVGGPQDLPHVRVGGLEGSAAVAYLEEQGIRSALLPGIQAGLEALAGGSIDAFVHDAPILRDHQRADFPGVPRVLPGPFLEQYYGIALPQESPHQNAINQILLEQLAGEDWDRQKLRQLGGD